MLLIGGFGGPGECPSHLIAAVARKAVRNLTIVGNSGGWRSSHPGQPRPVR